MKIRKNVIISPDRKHEVINILNEIGFRSGSDVLNTKYMDNESEVRFYASTDYSWNINLSSHNKSPIGYYKKESEFWEDIKKMIRNDYDKDMVELQKELSGLRFKYLEKVNKLIKTIDSKTDEFHLKLKTLYDI